MGERAMSKGIVVDTHELDINIEGHLGLFNLQYIQINYTRYNNNSVVGVVSYVA